MQNQNRVTINNRTDFGTKLSKLAGKLNGIFLSFDVVRILFVANKAGKYYLQEIECKSPFWK